MSAEARNVVAATKRYVGDARFRVRLFETIAQETRRLLQELDSKDVTAGASWSEDEFRRRVGIYGGAFAELGQATALIGRWGKTDSGQTLSMRSRELVTVLSGAGTQAGCGCNGIRRCCCSMRAESER